MILRYNYFSNRLYSTFISKSKTMNMNKCYFRYIQQDDKIDITFLLNVKGSVRQFNFNRKPTESLQVLLSRIKTNIQKVMNKGNKKKKTCEDTGGDFPIEFYDSNNVIISENSTCNELFTMNGPVKLKMADNFYEVVFNSPWVLNMHLPHSILAGFPVYPENFEVLYSKHDKCIFNWYKSSASDDGKQVKEEHLKWELTGNKFVYTPYTQDVGLKLKFECIPGNDEMFGPAVDTISKNLIEAGPGKCPFETRHMFTKQKLKDASFRCVSYNILADLYCDSDYTRTVLHPYCPPYALHIDYRKQLILKELLGYNSDIICLQEVDSKIFRNCLSPIMNSEGLDGLFYKKGKEVAEGLACFYRKNRFECIGDERIVLSEAVKTESYLQSIWDKIKNNKALTERLLDRSTVSSATFLQSIDNPNEVLIVANTHLYFHPDADHIRLIQGGLVVYWLMDIKKKLITKFPHKRVSVVLCGDFNSVPSCGIYQLYTTGASPSNLPDWKSNTDEAVYDLSLEQNISFGSACGTPSFTNYTAEFADCLDYIFYDKSNIEVEQVVPLPSDEELKLHTALPSVVFPSDHIALVSDLRFK